MAFMWRGFRSIKEKLQSYSSFKYFLVVPLLVVLAIGSYQIGHSSGAMRNAARESEKEAVNSRYRRQVDLSSSNSNMTILTSGPVGGAVYTRWGRIQCPSEADTIYSGVAGGSWFDVHGGGSNYLCLPMDPLWGNYKEDVEKHSKLYGSEYHQPTGINLKNLGGRTAHDHNVPCAVCRSRTKSSVVMIPARNICYNGWNLEYSGYLMSGASGHKARTEFVCVDESPESDPAGYRDENGALFYSVEGICGSLPCPPYVQRREITCAVCTQ